MCKGGSGQARDPGFETQLRKAWVLMARKRTEVPKNKRNPSNNILNKIYQNPILELQCNGIYILHFNSVMQFEYKQQIIR